MRFTDASFCEAAIHWLISTDQPIQAFEHPSFKMMIDIAMRAPNYISLPNRKATRQEILNMFKSQLTKLKDWLNSPVVKGQVSLTCDAWQALNVDASLTVQ